MSASKGPRPHRRKGQRAKAARQDVARMAENSREPADSPYEDLVDKITDQVIEKYGDVLTKLAKDKTRYADADEMADIRERLKTRNTEARWRLKDM